ncbi:hypothetical protein F511_05683 [Dorcoceras hygrometricum]|uniref:Uncharacterized protein n=1 Tax=Dorcoceras hygrometricum TaxID=472368 RepID=A0A2Z7D324_9LAMI|nr:hypothetical protein F511_05683 [Dorcoceras hygrometricum]
MNYRKRVRPWLNQDRTASMQRASVVTFGASCVCYGLWHEPWLVQTGTQRNGDRPAGAPLGPAWLPEDPASGQHRPKTQKQENKYEVKPQYEELSKQLIMLHAIINAMKCIRSIKDWIARPVYQLANHLSQPLYPHGVSTGEIIDSQGTAQPIEASQPSPATAITVETPWNSNLYQESCSNSYLQQLISTSTDSQGTAQPIEASQPSPATAITVETPWNSNLYQVSNNQLNLNSTSKVLRSSSITQLPNPTEYFSTLKRGLNLARNYLPKSAQHPKNALPDFSRNLRTPAASRSIPQVVLQSLMGNNRKIKPQGVQRHPNRRKQRLESTKI